MYYFHDGVSGKFNPVFTLTDYMKLFFVIIEQTGPDEGYVLLPFYNSSRTLSSLVKQGNNRPIT